MTNCRVSLCLLVVLAALSLVACDGRAVVSEPEIADLAWQALEPNTHSHDRTNWEVADIRQTKGGEVAAEFEGEPAPGCLGPEPPPNSDIEASRTYGYVHFTRRPATPPPEEPTLSPTAPPNVPEPFMVQAFFLIDITERQVVARKLYCVIY